MRCWEDCTLRCVILSGLWLWAGNLMCHRNLFGWRTQCKICRCAKHWLGIPGLPHTGNGKAVLRSFSESLESADGSGVLRMDQLLSSFAERRFGARFVRSEWIPFPQGVAHVF
jgi:hypothetical protein